MRLVVHVLLVYLVHCVAVTDAVPISHALRKRMKPLSTEFLPPWKNYTLCLYGVWITENYTSCGEGYCRCKGNTADCSSHHGNLTYIPSLPSGITQLAFTDNDLNVIQHDDFFINVTGIAVLDLSFNSMSYVSAGALRPLRKLSVFCSNFNNMTYTTLAPVLSVTTLKLLDLSFNLIGPPPDGIFHIYRLPQLEILNLMFMDISYLNMSVFAPLSTMRRLQLVGNHLSRGTLATVYLPHLQALDLSENSFETYLDTCQHGDSVFPGLSVLDLSENPFNVLRRPFAICLPRLTTFYLCDTSIPFISTGMFGPALFPSLRHLILHRNTKLDRVSKHAFSHPLLEMISLRGSELDFHSDAKSTDMFADCPKLAWISLEGNDFQDVTELQFNRLFRQPPNLATLILKSTKIGHLREVMFSNFTQLRELQLDGNKLGAIPDGVFDALPNLRSISLSRNHISTVRETTFSLATRQRLQSLFLSNNSFLCSCDLRWFRQWLLTNPSVFSDAASLSPWNRYLCENIPSTTVQSFFIPDQACLVSQAASKFIIATIIILMFPLALGATLYRYRWHIRLLLYEAYRGRGDRWRRLQEQYFRYDVFVSYDKEDLNWVREHLMPELEGRLGLRLCIHQRDFTLGAPIVENIEESVKDSKKVMMIFSKNFVHSQWCQFELQLCLSHVLQHDDSLLVVLLEDIPSRDLTPAMMAVMKTTTYIEWADEPEAITSFWQRLRLALNEILETVQNGRRVYVGSRET